MKKIYILFFTFCVFNSAFGQQNTFLRFYHNYLGRGSCVIETDSGGFMLTSPGFSANYDFIIKTDSLGNELASKTYCSRKLFRIVRSPDSNYVFISSSVYQCAIPGNNPDLIITKINSNLDTLWVREYGTTAWENGSTIRILNDGNYIVCASTSGSLTDNLFKLDTFGNIIWQHNVPFDLFNVIQDSDSNIVVCGGDLWRITKTNSDGDSIIWNKVYGTTAVGGQEGFLDLMELADGNYLVGGWYETPEFPYEYLKIDKMTGDTLWSKQSARNFFSVNNGHNGNIVIADGGVKLIDQAGNIIWDIVINAYFYYAIPTSDGGYIAAGHYYEPPTYDIRPVLLKTDSLGNFSSTTEINELTKSEDYNFYPNPLTAQSKLTFKNPNKEKFLFTLYDITGRITERVSTTNNEIILNKGSKTTDSYREGVYLFNLMNEKTGERWNGKIVISDK